MGEIVIRVKDESKREFLLRLLDELEFVEVVRTKKKPSKHAQEIVKGIKEALKEVELHQQGKIKLQTAEDLINEIWPKS